MATKTKNNTRSKVQKTLSDLNNILIKRSEEAIEGTVKTGEQYQKLFAKALKKSEPVVAKQVDLVFDALEGVKGQVEYTGERFKTLVNWDEISVTEWRKEAEKNLKDLRKEAEERVSDLRKDAEKRIKDLRKKAEDVVEDIQEEVMTFGREEKKSTAKKATAKKATAKKTSTRKSTASKSTTTAAKVKKTTTKAATAKKMVNLKLIDGVGPQMEKILKAAGIDSIETLATYTKTKLVKIVEEAGPRYRMIDPSTWVKQAKELIK